MTGAGDVAVVPDATNQQVDLFVVGVVVPRNQVFVVAESHPMQVSLADLGTLRIRQVLARGRQQRDMQLRLAKLRPNLVDLPEFLGQLARIGAFHIRLEQPALLLGQVVFELAAETLPLNGLCDHRRPSQFRATPGAAALPPSPRAPAARWRAASAGSGLPPAVPVRRTALG